MLKIYNLIRLMAVSDKLVASVTTPTTTQHKPKTGSRKWDKKTKDKKT